MQKVRYLRLIILAGLIASGVPAGPERENASSEAAYRPEVAAVHPSLSVLQAAPASAAVVSPTLYLPTLLNQRPTPTATPTATPTPRPSATPTATPTSPPTSGEEWSQHAHDAQRTGYTAQVVNPPWRWRWAWNGPNSSGGIAKVTANGSLPRNVQPVTGGGRVYIAAGTDGVFALSEATGAQQWRRNPGGAIASTVAYDKDTQAVFAVSTNGTLYKMSAANGETLGQFSAGAASTLPLPPAVLADRVLFAMGNKVFAVNKTTLQPIWAYDAGAAVHTPPAYSATRDRVVVGAGDLFVHAINNADGTRAWRVRPVHASLRPGFGEPPGATGFAEYQYGWPVVADAAGYVLIKVRLDWESLWTWNWPTTNAQMRANLIAQPEQQALFALDLDDGTQPFIANIGSGGYGDGGYLPMGPQPVVKRLPNGKDVVYTIVRGTRSQDSRWDSHFGEMMLDDATVGGYGPGDVRFIAFDYPPGASDPYLITDEQPNVSMAGDYLFGGHWEAGFALRITDRSAARGGFDNRITSQKLPTIATSQDDGACSFSASHYCSAGLANTRSYDFGFYIYYHQGAVYDRYWSEYAVWVVSNDNVYFRSADGAIVALTSGTPQAATAAVVAEADGDRPQAPDPATLIAAPIAPPAPEATISHVQAREYAGRVVEVEGEIRYVFNNGKQVLLGFAHPHRGAFKVLIGKAHWPNFDPAPEQAYPIGRRIRVTGAIGWYQGDPVIYATHPSQIVVLHAPAPDSTNQPGAGG